jgi:hypothetical protein
LKEKKSHNDFQHFLNQLESFPNHAINHFMR